MKPKIVGIGTAVPEYCITQQEIKEYVTMLFDMIHLPRLLPVFDNAGIERRHLAQPLEWYSSAHSFAESNAVYEKAALQLAEKAARQALDRARIPAAAIGAIIFVSSTGIATPTIDSKLIPRLGLSLHTVRLPLWGLGCAGGAAGVARAAEVAQTMPAKAVLCIAVELCSLTFQRNDCSKANIVGTGLFADGAAAVVLAAEGEGPAICGSVSTLFDNTQDVMGWDVVESGLKVRFSKDIPAIVSRYMPDLMEYACQLWQVEHREVGHYIVHPGGPKVIEAYQASLDIQPGKLADAYEVLAQFGNMSSATVLFVLDRYLRRQPASGQYGVMASLGPGFCAEQVLFQW